MTMHTLKITDGWWRELTNCKKLFELRRNDRNYQVGDRIVFTNINGVPREHERTYWLVTHVLTDAEGLVGGYAALSVSRRYRALSEPVGTSGRDQS